MSRTAPKGVVLVIVVALSLVWNNSVGDDDSSPLSRFLSRRRRRRRRRLNGTSNKGMFLGVPVTYQPIVPPYSTAHCIGETFDRVDPLFAWLYRSCEFRHICYDTNRQEFVLFPSPQEQKLAKMAAQQEGVTLSSTSLTRPPVSLAAVDPPDNLENKEDAVSELFSNLSWFPIVDDWSKERPVGYYQLPDTHILVPFLESRPMSNDSIQNKDWLSIFALLNVFGLEDKSLILLRHEASAATQSKCDSECQSLLQTHLPALGIRQPRRIMMDNKSSSSLPQSALVCARYGAAGLGMLMTGSKPVWRDNKWTNTHVVGRDATLRAFQEFVNLNTEQSS